MNKKSIDNDIVGHDILAQRIKGIYGNEITRNKIYIHQGIKYKIDYEIEDGPYLVWYIYQKISLEEFSIEYLIEMLFRFKTYKAMCEQIAEHLNLIPHVVVFVYLNENGYDYITL